ncbi:AraC family transcriptional regulator [uncultured Robinsoniella sp.]|uniref:AraC family transcriptional regulator n=1 Tax=uncultured Robinsoniella sp. TaxID=904190 RepID=UPI00374E6EA3
MKTRKEKFPEYIKAYHEDEIFYRKLYEEEQMCPDEFENFVAGLDREYLRRHELYVPAIHGQWLNYLNENELFKTPADHIVIQKHYRYSPEYIHEHEFYEIFYVYDGACENSIQNVKYSCRKGDVCILPPKTKHSIAVFDDSIVINIMLKASTFHEVFFDIFTGKNVLSQFFAHILYDKTENNYLLFHTGEDEGIRSLVEDLYMEYEGRVKFFETIMKNEVMTFFCLLLRNHENHLESFLNTSHKNLDMLGVLNYLQKHYADVTLKSAAEHFNFSVPHFSKLIKENTGKNFVEILKNIRLEKACYALVNTDLSIMTICEIIGYPNPEHFSRLFKKEFKMTPGAYRKSRIPS